MNGLSSTIPCLMNPALWLFILPFPQKYHTYGTEIQMSMGFDATCRGLRSPTDGPFVMQFYKGNHTENSIQSHGKFHKDNGKFHKEYPFLIVCSLDGILSFGNLVCDGKQILSWNYCHLCHYRFVRMAEAVLRFPWLAKSKYMAGSGREESLQLELQRSSTGGVFPQEIRDKAAVARWISLCGNDTRAERSCDLHDVCNSQLVSHKLHPGDAI